MTFRDAIIILIAALVLVIGLGVATLVLEDTANRIKTWLKGRK